MSKSTTGSGPPPPTPDSPLGLNGFDGFLPDDISDAIGEDEVSALDSGATALLSTPLVSGISEGSSDWSWAFESGSTDIGSSAATATARSADGALSNFTGSPGDRYSSPFIDPDFEDANVQNQPQPSEQNTNTLESQLATLTAAEKSQWQASLGPVAVGDSTGGRQIVDDAWNLGAQTPIDTRDNLGDGFTYYHYQITIDGVDYDAYKSENHNALSWDQVLLIPTPAPPAPPPDPPTPPAPAATTAPALPTTLAGAANQILSGTFADSVLQDQLSHQGLVPGAFVSPFPPYDTLFNPNATNLIDAMLLASHSPNVRLQEADSAQLGVSMAPVVGSVATWMNPHSTWWQKGIATLGMLSTASSLAGAFKLSALAPELRTLGSELESEENLQHVLGGGPNDRGVAVLHLDVSALSDDEINTAITAVRDMDYQAAIANKLVREGASAQGLVRTAVPKGSALAALKSAGARVGRELLDLDSEVDTVAGHTPDVAGGGNPLGPIMSWPRTVNSQIAGQWGRYGPGFKFDGFSLIDRNTGEFLYNSLEFFNETPPAPILDFQP